MIKQEIQEFLEITGVTEEDMILLASYRSRFEQIADTVVDNFYEKLFSIPHVRDKFMQFGNLERAKKMQRAYFMTIFDGKVDEEYVKLRHNIGQIHARIDLSPQDYSAFYRFYMVDALEHLLQIITLSTEEYHRLASALIKVSILDMSMTLSKYHEEYQKRQNDNRNKMIESAKILSSTVEELTATTADFANQAINLSQLNQDTVVLVTDLHEQMRNLEAINKMINEIAGQTHMLGLNAAIEAARAGNMGSGFGVVAEEIRRLASESKSKVETITENLKNINDVVNQILKESKSVAEIADMQAASAEEVAASIEQLSKLAFDLSR